MSKAPSKKALAEAGRRKLEAFRRAKAKGSAATRTEAVATSGANAEVELNSTAPTADETVSQARHDSKQQANACSRPVFATGVLVPAGAGSPDPGGAASAGSGSDSGGRPCAAAPTAPTTAEPAPAQQPSADGDSRTSSQLPAAADDAAEATQLPALEPQAAVPLVAAEARLADSSSQPAQVNSQLDQHLPLVPQQVVGSHGAAAASKPPGMGGREQALQPQQHSPPANYPSLPLAREHESAVRLTERASFEASHSPFIALSRTASGRMSINSATNDSEPGGNGTSRSSANSRLASGMQLSEATSQLSTAAPGLRQPWYAKLFAAAPEGEDSNASTIGRSAGSWQPSQGMQDAAAGHSTSPPPAGAAASTDAAPRVAAADLGSALEAFMGIEDDKEDMLPTAAKPSAPSSHRSAAEGAEVLKPSAALAPPAAAAAPPVAPRTNGYAALADGYIGAASPVQAVPSAAIVSTEFDHGASRPEIGVTASAPAAASTLPPTYAAASLHMAQLGRPVSFQDWAGQSAQLPGHGLATGDGAIASGRLYGPSSSGSAHSNHMELGSSAADVQQQPGPWPRAPSEPSLPPDHHAVDGQAQAEQAVDDIMPASEPLQKRDAEGRISGDSREAQVDGDAFRVHVTELPPPKHSASAALANGISAWLAAPSTPEAPPNSDGLLAPDRSAAFLKELSGNGPASGSEARSSLALREHIDQLTREAFELRRGLTQQAELASTLAAENATLTDDYNRERERTRELEASLERVRGEVSAHGLVLESLSIDCDAARGAAREAADRIKVLAAEVVALEEARVAARAAEVRASAAARDAGDEARAAKAQAAKLAAERESLAAAVSSLQAEKQALRVKLRRAGGSAEVAAITPIASQQQQQQPAAVLQSVPQPDTPDVVAAAVSGEHRGAGAAGASDSTESTATGASLPAAANLQSDSEAGDAVKQRHSSRRIAAAAAAAASARSAASDATAAGPSVAVLQQLLPWRVTGLGNEAGGTAGLQSEANVGSPSADEAVRWATQRNAAALGAIHRTLEVLAEEKRSCLAALEAQQAEIAEARTAARDARRKLAATQQRLELMVGRSMLQEAPIGVDSASAPASPAQKPWPQRQGSAQPRDHWKNGHGMPPLARQQRSLLH